jgi:hypothetical protein
MGKDDGLLWFDSTGSLRQRGSVSLPIGLGMLASWLRVFIKRVENSPKNEKGNFVPSRGAEDLWVQVTMLSSWATSKLLFPGAPTTPSAEHDSIEGCAVSILPNARPLAECLNAITFAIPWNPDGTWTKEIAVELVSSLYGATDEVDLHCDHVRRSPPDGEPAEFDPPARLCWRLAVVEARSIELRSAVDRALRSAAPDGEAALNAEVASDLTRVRWAYLNAIDAAAEAVTETVPLVDPRDPTMRHLVAVQLSAALSSLRSWEMVAKRACQKEPCLDEAATAFPVTALETLNDSAACVASAIWPLTAAAPTAGCPELPPSSPPPAQSEEPALLSYTQDELDRAIRAFRARRSAKYAELREAIGKGRKNSVTGARRIFGRNALARELRCKGSAMISKSPVWKEIRAELHLGKPEVARVEKRVGMEVVLASRPSGGPDAAKAVSEAELGRRIGKLPPEVVRSIKSELASGKIDNDAALRIVETYEQHGDDAGASQPGGRS